MECNICKREFLNQRSLSAHYFFHSRKPIYDAAKEKLCGLCGDLKPIREFRQLRRKGHLKYFNSYCNKCEKKRNRTYQKEHPGWYKQQLARGYLNWKMRATGGKCQICGEGRTLDIAHVIPRNGKPKARLEPIDNLLGLCPTHHRLFDENKLNGEEYKKIKEKVEGAKKKYG